MSKYVGILVGIMLSQTALAYKYVSIAAVTLTNSDGSPRGHFGKGWSNYSDQAEQIAMESCGNAACKIIATNSGCVAIAYDTNKRVMAQTGPDMQTAQDNVTNFCQTSGAGGCVLWSTVCADGYDSGT
jgi:hypothetical protein